jgi:Family of unknown function (DUF6498)
VADPGFHPSKKKEIEKGGATPGQRRAGLARHLPKIVLADLRKPSALALVLANLIPLYGVLFLRWQTFPLIFLYWSENVIIGVMNVLRMLVASPRSLSAWGFKLFLIPFFCIHYGIFTAVHGIFVMAFLAPPGVIKESFPSVSAFVRVIQENGLLYPILTLALSHVFSFFVNYLGKGNFRTASLDNLMAKPYSRVAILHITILLGGFLMMALKSPILGLILLVVLKIVFDLSAHLREHRSLLGSDHELNT